MVNFDSYKDPPEEPFVCETCGATHEDDCICKECPVCEEYGNPNCYKEHGMKYTIEQINKRNQYELYCKMEAYLEQLAYEEEHYDN